MGATDVTDIEDVIFEKADVGSAIKAATFPYLVRRSLSDFGEHMENSSMLQTSLQNTEN